MHDRIGHRAQDDWISTQRRWKKVREGSNSDGDPFQDRSS